jgi:hypothetical protein
MMCEDAQDCKDRYVSNQDWRCDFDNHVFVDYVGDDHNHFKHNVDHRGPGML